MRVPFVFVVLLAIACAQTACKKETLHQTVHSDTTLYGNQPPNYTGVPTLNIRLYVNKLYVDMLGREPSPAELDNATNALIAQQLSSAAREQVVQQLLNDTIYYRRLFELTAADFIDGAGDPLIDDDIALLTLVKQLAIDNGDTTLLFFYDDEINRLNELKQADVDYASGAITLNGYYQRFLHNFRYDQINMGSLNFVNAAFDDLFLRHPTEQERTQGIQMVDNYPAQLFLTDGTNKGDFIDISTHADAFYEGLARKQYLQLLLREPDTQEIGAAIAIVKPAGDLKALQLKLLTTKEYAGF